MGDFYDGAISLQQAEFILLNFRIKFSNPNGAYEFWSLSE